VETNLIVVVTPIFDDHPGFVQRIENFTVEKFVAKHRFEAFAIAVFPWASWLDIGDESAREPPVVLAVLPLIIVIAVNLVMSLVLLPRLDASYLAEEAWGATSLSVGGGVWAVVTALAAAIVVLVAINFRRLPLLRASMDAGVNASAPPVLSVASLVGFGSVVASLPAFAMVRDWVLGIEGGPLVSLAVATNVLAALTGSASGGLTIALDSLGGAYEDRRRARH
jgi:H+/gluconate symporter-like permease